MRKHVDDMTLEELALELQRVIVGQIIINEDDASAGGETLANARIDEIMNEFRRRDLEALAWLE